MYVNHSAKIGCVPGSVCRKGRYGRQDDEPGCFKALGGPKRQAADHEDQYHARGCILHLDQVSNHNRSHKLHIFQPMLGITRSVLVLSANMN